jgi:ABC-type branched-subunit amino acid transport system substrate-binding protein
VLSLWSRRSVFRGTVLLAYLLILSACSSLATNDGSGGPPAAQPGSSADIGTGAVKVGLITTDRADALSDGVPGSAFLAANLASDSINTSPITVLARETDGSAASLDKIAREFEAAQVKLVIVPSSDTIARTVASSLGRKGATIVTLGSTSAPAVNLFAFGTPAATEASLMSDELRRRGYRSVVIVSDPTSDANIFASQLASGLLAAKIEVVSVDGRDAAGATARIKSMAAGTIPPSAIVFLESPSAAALVAKELRKLPSLQVVPMVGASSWGTDLAGAKALIPGWYMAADGNTLGSFATRFAKTYGRPATMDGAMTYDLLVLAAALPQIIKDRPPYGAEVLQNEQGFVGITGKFYFGSDGQVGRTFYAVDLAMGTAR